MNNLKIIGKSADLYIAFNKRGTSLGNSQKLILVKTFSILFKYQIKSPKITFFS